MLVITRNALEVQEALAGRKPAFVPTMGALHAGHAALIRRARETAGPPPARVAVSIFVNPTQFGPGEDFTRYPRQLEQDLAVCEQAGADVIFAPSVDVMYPAGPEKVAEGFRMPALPDVATQPKLEDAFRPVHFKGVCQVVARLLDLVQPAQAIFGEKDYQQLLVIRAMVEQANAEDGQHEPARASSPRWPGLQIIAHPTVRESDGLAMSSRNAYLSDDERRRAVALHEALQRAQSGAKRNESPRDIERAMSSLLMQAGFAIDYAVVRDAATLMPIGRIDRPCRALIAARIGGPEGNVRLIDNAAITAGQGATRAPIA